MTSTLRFNLGDVHLRDEERRETLSLPRDAPGGCFKILEPSPGDRWGNRSMQNSRNFSRPYYAAKCQWLWPCLRLRPGFCLLVRLCLIVPL